MQNKINEYLKEMNKLCQKYELWPEGREMVLVNNLNEPVAKNLEYDHEWRGLTATTNEFL